MTPQGTQGTPKATKKGQKMLQRTPLERRSLYLRRPLESTVPAEQNSLRKEPELTWNGKRGFVKDVACVWVCPACVSTALFLVLGLWPALGNATRIREKPRGPPKNAPGHTKGAKKPPTSRPKDHLGAPRGPQETPNAPQRTPEGHQKTTLKHQGAPKRHPKHPKGPQKASKRPPRAPQGTPNGTKKGQKRPQELPWIFFGSTLRKCCKYQQKPSKNSPKRNL